jgi:hypothetical protein
MPFDTYFTDEDEIKQYFALKKTAMEELFGTPLEEIVPHDHEQYEQSLIEKSNLQLKTLLFALGGNNCALDLCRDLEICKLNVEILKQEAKEST